MEPINLYLGEESRLVIEGFDSDKEASKSSYENSIFKDSYNKAFSVILDIAQNVIGKKKKGENDPSLFFRQTADSVKNNVVAFLGDRGTGKTSCMLSVANMLRKIDDCPSCAESATKIKDICKEGGFEILETIDPSYFDNKTNILEIVLGRLFTKFNDRVNKGNLSDDPNYDSKKENLFEQFQRVKESLAQMKSKDCICEDDNVEGLLKLTASVNMRNDIQMLVTQYLEFVSESFLVVPIDDLDMHTEHAYEMAEQIRKYLKQSNVIVLMALKLEQLEQAIELRNRNHYDKMIGKSISESEISDMSLKYVIKLIPESNRIYMPDAKKWIDCVVNVYVESPDGTVEHDGKKWKQKNEKKEKQTVKYYVTSMIFKKTRYLFYHFQGFVSLIVPSNLRELRLLIELLNGMDDFNEKRRAINQSLFKQYLLSTRCLDNISSDGKKFLKELFRIDNPAYINRFVIEGLDHIYHDEFLKNTQLSKELENIRDDRNFSYNISIGDALFFVNALKKIHLNKSDQLLFFMIETFYSIRLYECYDMMTDKIHSLKKKSDDVDSNLSPVIKKRSLFDSYSAYEIMIGGCFYHLHNNRIWNPLKYDLLDKRIGLEYRLVDVDAILNLWEKYKKNKDVAILRVVEFLTLCLSSDSDLMYRSKEKLSNESDVSKMDSKWIRFDLLSIFANLVNVERQYNRVSLELYDEAKNNKESIYNIIIDCCKKERPDSKNQYLSCVCIRNVEILDDFINYLKEINLKTKTEYNQIIQILEWMSKYEMNNYNTKNNLINFSFFCSIAEALEKSKNSEELFRSVYNSRIAFLQRREISRIEGVFNDLICKIEYPITKEKFMNYLYNAVHGLSFTLQQRIALNVLGYGKEQIDSKEKAKEIAKSIIDLYSFEYEQP
ncbi:MAG: hypothetical protein J5534_09820 [Fibrobacter sp.]|nr:hypothetical protein [Fibrobacter sp.]